MKRSKFMGRKLLVASLFLLPITICLYIVSLYSNELITKPLSVILLIASILLFLQLVFSIYLCCKKGVKKAKVKVSTKILFSIFFVFYYLGAIIVMILFYGPNATFREFLITSAMTTMDHQYFATWFYNNDIVDKVLDNNVVDEIKEESDQELVSVGNIDFNKIIFKNKYEEEILTKEEGNDLYKIIDISRDGYKGKLAVIYDPSKVKIATSKYMGTSIEKSSGQYLIEITKQNNAVIGINASGFFDPAYNSMGGVPRGYVISNGKLVADNKWGRSYGGLVGFDKDNKLILSTKMDAKQALNAGIRDGIQYGPFLVVNGKPSYIKGNGGWGIAPRTAIGQREDGIVLLLTIDGRQKESMGADMVDLTQIMVDYGAVNAANMDGGTSTGMALNSKLISKPRNGNFEPYTRAIPNAWIVVK